MAKIRLFANDYIPVGRFVKSRKGGTKEITKRTSVHNLHNWWMKAFGEPFTHVSDEKGKMVAVDVQPFIRLVKMKQPAG